MGINPDDGKSQWAFANNKVKRNMNE